MTAFASSQFMSATASFSETKKRGFLEGGFCKRLPLSWRWRSECKMYCCVQYFGVFSVFSGVTLDCAETPFAKTPFSRFLSFGHFFDPAETFLGILCPRRPGDSCKGRAGLHNFFREIGAGQMGSYAKHGVGRIYPDFNRIVLFQPRQGTPCTSENT